MVQVTSHFVNFSMCNILFCRLYWSKNFVPILMASGKDWEILILVISCTTDIEIAIFIL